MTPNQRLPRLVLGEGIVLSLLVVWLGEGLVGMDGSAEEVVPRLVRTLLAALPFAILSLYASNLLEKGGRTAEAEVLGAVALVTAGFLLLWGWYLFEAMRPSGAGANIGMGIIMIFSPLILAMLIPPGRWLGRKRAVQVRGPEHHQES